VAGGVVACAVLVLAVLRLTGPPEIETGSMTDAEAQACRDLVADLPTTVLGEDRVEVEGDTAYGAAWGDPAIVLTCGVDAVDTRDAPPCLMADGVGWIVVEEGDDDTVFVADGYEPRVRVVVPDDYAPEADAVTELGGLVEEHAELEHECL
jgi:hypothetical protein